METPYSSLRISIPKILAEHIAPYSLAPDRVMSDPGRPEFMARSVEEAAHLVVGACTHRQIHLPP